MKKDQYISHDIEFLVVDINSPYNAILEHNSINAFKMAVLMAHLKVKFPTPNRVGMCKGDQKVAHNLYLKALKGNQVYVIYSKIDAKLKNQRRLIE